MNRILLTLKRPFIWLYRFRHRCGYGVHSPFAFNLITHVIYESTAYYKYEELAKAQKQLELEKDKRWKYESKKVKRLLFRLVNYTQPETIVDAGTLAASALYLKAGKEGADYTSASDRSELFRICSTRTRGKSVFVIEGIRYTPQMFALWKRMKQDGRAGITFDLYDLGIIFFDKTKIKQDYIVNF